MDPKCEIGGLRLKRLKGPLTQFFCVCALTGYTFSPQAKWTHESINIFLDIYRKRKVPFSPAEGIIHRHHKAHGMNRAF